MAGSLLLMARVQGPLKTYLQTALAAIDQAAGNEEALWEISARGEQLEMAGRIIAGLANRELSTRVDNRRLSDELRQRGRSRGGFYDAIAALEVFEALPDSHSVESLASLGWTKTRAVLAWQPEERLALAHGEAVRGLTLDEAVKMPTREFERAARTKHSEDAAEIERLRLDLETAQKSLKAYEHEASLRHRAVALPAWAAAAREEAVYQGDAITAALDVLVQAWERDICEAKSTSGSHAAFERARVAAAGSLYHTLVALYTRSGALMAEIAETFGKDVTRGFAPDFALTADEVEAVDLVRRRIVDDAKKAAANRAIERENSTPGKRGRKRKAVG